MDVLEQIAFYEFLKQNMLTYEDYDGWLKENPECNVSEFIEEIEYANQSEKEKWLR